MLTNKAHEEIAAKIYPWFQEKSQMSLLTVDYPDIHIDDAYQIQNSIVLLFKQAGSLETLF